MIARSPGATPARPRDQLADALSETDSAADFLRTLVRTASALRSFGKGPAALRLEASLLAKVERHLGQWGACRLSVDGDRLRLEPDVVYEAAHPGDVFSCLARDGVSHLTLLPGLDAEELHDLLALLNRAAAACGRDEDLVTLLWERSFRFIVHALVEDLGEEEAAPAAAATALHGRPERLDPQQLLELAQPVAHLPVASCQPSEAEIEAIQAELAVAEAGEEWREIADLAAELVELEPDEAEREAIAASLVEIADRLRERSGADAVFGLLLRLGEVSEGEFLGSAPVAQLYARLARELALPSRLEPLLEGLAAGASAAGTRLTAFLVRLGPAAFEPLLAWLEGDVDPGLRRAGFEALQRAEPDALLRLEPRYPGEATPSPARLRNVLELLELDARIVRFPLVQQVLAGTDAELRLALARALGPSEDGAVRAAWLRLLEDADARVQRLAIDRLARSRPGELAAHLRQVAARAGFTDLDREYKTLVLSTIARLEGDAALAWLSAWLAPGRRRLIISRRTAETERAVITAIRAVGSPAARRLLSDLAQAGDRHIRAAATGSAAPGSGPG